MINKKRLGKCCSYYLSDKVGTMLRCHNRLTCILILDHSQDGTLAIWTHGHYLVDEESTGFSIRTDEGHVDHRWIQQYDQKYPDKAGRSTKLYQLSKITISYLDIPNAIPIGPEIVQEKATRECGSLRRRAPGWAKCVAHRRAPTSQIPVRSHKLRETQTWT